MKALSLVLLPALALSLIFAAPLVKASNNSRSPAVEKTKELTLKQSVERYLNHVAK